MSKNVAHQLVEFLVDAGVKRIYGIVGDSLNPVTDALHKSGKIKWVHVRHEEVAAFAASADAQISGELAVCCGSSGPGNLHLINGLFDAHHSKAPVLAIASHLSLSQLGNDYFQETHPQFLFQECSEYAELVSVPSQVITIVKNAVNHAVGKKGVGVVVLPGDVAGTRADQDDRSRFVPPDNPVVIPSPEGLQAMADLVNKAERVTFFCGAGCEGAAEDVISLAQKIKAPIGYTFRGKEWMEYNNPNGIGMTGLLGWGDAYKAMHDCDLLIMWGTDFPYKDYLPTNTVIIQVDIRPAHLGRRCKLDLGLTGNVKDTVRALMPLVNEKEDDAHLKQSLKRHAASVKKIHAYVQDCHGKSPIRPELVAHFASIYAKDDAIFTVDTGTPDIWAARFVNAAKGRRIIGSFKHGSMACALAMGLGAQMAAPSRQVIALCGDGGLSMLPGDLITLVQYKLPVKIIVFNNDCLDFIRIEMQAVGLVPSEIDLHNPDFSRVAQAMGLYGERVTECTELPAAMRRVLDHDGPALLDAVVAANALALPPHITWDQAKGFSLSLMKQALSGNFSDAWETVIGNSKLRP